MWGVQEVGAPSYTLKSGLCLEKFRPETEPSACNPTPQFGAVEFCQPLVLPWRALSLPENATPASW